MARTKKRPRSSAAAAQKRDLFQEVTDQIIQALEEGVVPWICPWDRGNPFGQMPVSGSTGAFYGGVNVLILWLAAYRKGYSSPTWYTFGAAKRAVGYVWGEDAKTKKGRWVWGGEGEDPGYGVRKGEKATTITFWKRKEIREEGPNGEESKETVYFPIPHHVFNAEQIEGLPVSAAPAPPERTEWERIQEAEAFFQRTNLNIIEQGTRAAYVPATDLILMPARCLFRDAESYYATLAHEGSHATGHETRVGRPLTGKFGSPEYAFEELIAELGAAFVCASLGITGDLQHPEYIASWLEELKGDKRYIFRAASEARKAAEFLGAGQSVEAEETEEMAEAA